MSEDQQTFTLDDLQKLWAEHKTKRVVDLHGRIICTYTQGKQEHKIRFPLLGGRVAERLRSEMITAYADGLAMIMVGALQTGILPGLGLASQDAAYGAASISEGLGLVTQPNRQDFLMDTKYSLFAHVERYVPQVDGWVKLLASSADECRHGEVWVDGSADKRHIPRPGKDGENDVQTGYDVYITGGPMLYVSDKVFTSIILENLGGFIGAVLSSRMARLLRKLSGSPKRKRADSDGSHLDTSPKSST